MDFNNLIYKPSSGDQPGRGSLLIAEPLMKELHFQRSVILLLDSDNEGGHMGLALNKATSLTLRDLMPDWENGRDVPVYCGGPVDLQRLFMLHTLGATLPGSMEVSPGIYVGGDVEAIKDYVDSGGEIEGRLRFFLGYSGWHKDQLAGEIKRNSWAVNNFPDGSLLLSSEENDFWRREVENLGDNYRGWLMMPQEPWLN
ncbi:MAG: YqgE/AlgH family protein [Muribaculaceae bacterium]|nr:YqgE/AlgH family protein [Muribaculaceae bacterium]